MNGRSNGTRAHNEVQLFRFFLDAEDPGSGVDATAGSYRLTFSGQTTGLIAHDAGPTGVQAALEALSNIAPGDVTVIGSNSSFNLTFGGTLANTNVPEITSSDNTLTNGGDPLDIVITTATEGGEY